MVATSNQTMAEYRKTAKVSNIIPRIFGWIDPSNMGSHNQKRCWAREYLEVLGYQTMHIYGRFN
jgi:hypothetical protein